MAARQTDSDSDASAEDLADSAAHAVEGSLPSDPESSDDDDEDEEAELSQHADDLNATHSSCQLQIQQLTAEREELLDLIESTRKQQESARQAKEEELLTVISQKSAAIQRGNNLAEELDTARGTIEKQNEELKTVRSTLAKQDQDLKAEKARSAQLEAKCDTLQGQQKAASLSRQDLDASVSQADLSQMVGDFEGRLRQLQDQLEAANLQHEANVREHEVASRRQRERIEFLESQLQSVPSTPIAVSSPRFFNAATEEPASRDRSAVSTPRRSMSPGVFEENSRSLLSSRVSTRPSTAPNPRSSGLPLERSLSIGSSHSSSPSKRPSSASMTRSLGRASSARVPNSKLTSPLAPLPDDETYTELTKTVQLLTEENKWLQQCLAVSRNKQLAPLEKDALKPEGHGRWTDYRASERAAQAAMPKIIETLQSEGLPPDSNGYRQLHHLYTTRQAAQEELLAVRDECSALRSEAALTRTMLTELKSSSPQLQALKQEMERVHQQLVDNQRRLTAHTQKRSLEAKEREAHDVHTDEIVRELRAQHEKELQTAKLENHQLTLRISSLQSDLTHLTAQLNQKEQALTKTKVELDAARADSKTERLQLEARLKESQAAANNAQLRIAQLEAENGHLQTRVSQAFQSLEAERARLMTEVAAIKESDQGQLQFVRNEAENTRKSLQQHYDRNIKDIQADAQRQRDEAARIRTDLIAQNESLRQAWLLEAQRQKTEYMDSLQEQRATYESTFAQLRDDGRLERDQHVVQVNSLTAEKTRLTQELASTADALRHLQQAVSTKHTEFSQKMSSFNEGLPKDQQLTLITRDQQALGVEERLVLLSSNHEIVLNDLRSTRKHLQQAVQDHQAALRELERRHEEEVQRMSNEFKLTLANQERTLKLLQESHSTTEKRQVEAAHQMQNQYEKAFHQLKEESVRTQEESGSKYASAETFHASAVASLSQEFKQLQDAHSRSNTELGQCKESLRETSQSLEFKKQELSELQQRYDRDIKAQLANFTAEKAQLQASFHQELHQLRQELAKYMQEAAAGNETIAQLNRAIIAKETHIADLEKQCESERTFTRETLEKERELHRNLLEREQASKQQTVDTLKQEILRLTGELERALATKQSGLEQIRALQTDIKQLKSEHALRLQEQNANFRREQEGGQADVAGRLRDKDEALRLLQDASDRRLEEQRESAKQSQERQQALIEQLRNDAIAAREAHSIEVKELDRKRETAAAEQRSQVDQLRDEHSAALRALQEEKDKLLLDFSTANEALRSLTKVHEEKRVEIERLQDLLERQNQDLNSSRLQERDTLQQSRTRELEEKRRTDAVHAEKIQALTAQIDKLQLSLRQAQDQITVFQVENARIAKEAADENKAHMLTTKHLGDQLKQTQLDMTQHLAKAEADIGALKHTCDDEVRAKMAQIAQCKDVELKNAALVEQLRALEDKLRSLLEAVESAFGDCSRVPSSQAATVERNPNKQLQHIVEQLRKKHEALEACESKVQGLQKNLAEYASRVLNMETQLQEVQRTFSSADQELHSLKQAHAGVLSRCEFLSERQQALETEKQALHLKNQEAAEALRKQLEASAIAQTRAEGTITALRQQVAHNTELIENMTSDTAQKLRAAEEEQRRVVGLLGEKQKQAEALSQELREVREERSSTTAALAGETRLRAELESQRDRLQAQATSLSAELKQTHEALIKESARVVQLTDELTRSKRELQLLGKRVSDLEDVQASLNTRKSDLETKLAASELSSRDISHSLAAARAEAEDLAAARTKVLADLEASNRELSAARNELTRTKSALGDAESFGQSLSKSQRETRANSDRALLKKQEEADALRAEVETKQTMLSHEQSKAAQLKQLLDEERKSKNDLGLRLTAETARNAELKAELEFVRSEVDDAEAAKEQAQYRLNDEIAHLQSLLALEKKTVAAAAAENNRQLEVMKAKLLRQTQALESSEAQTRKLQEDNQRTLRSLEALRTERDSFNAKLSRQQTTIEDLEREGARLKRETASLKDELSRTQTAKKQVEERLRSEQTRALSELKDQLSSSVRGGFTPHQSQLLSSARSDSLTASMLSAVNGQST
eukprot:m.767594 g.767594  ORF g.767594 m.767594 type:complete len:2080 (-) comp59072_c0_seq2:42-6281(-)